MNKLCIVLLFIALPAFAQNEINHPELVKYSEGWSRMEKDIFFEALKNQGPVDVKAQFPELPMELILSLQKSSR
jgi:hypothetical protein